MSATYCQIPSPSFTINSSLKVNLLLVLKVLPRLGAFFLCLRITCLSPARPVYSTLISTWTGCNQQHSTPPGFSDRLVSVSITNMINNYQRLELCIFIIPTISQPFKKLVLLPKLLLVNLFPLSIIDLFTWIGCTVDGRSTPPGFSHYMLGPHVFKSYISFCSCFTSAIRTWVLLPCLPVLQESNPFGSITPLVPTAINMHGKTPGWFAPAKFWV